MEDPVLESSNKEDEYDNLSGESGVYSNGDLKTKEVWNQVGRLMETGPEGTSLIY